MRIEHEGMVMLICTMEHDHPGLHYDDIFSLEWE